MDDTRSKLLKTTFVRSWLGSARAGLELTTPDISLRTSAWAQWATLHLIEQQGAESRKYTCIQLPGRFYNPNGHGPTTSPHLEVSRSLMNNPAPEFPLRLALAGNALLSPWWVLPEALAAKRAILSPVPGEITALEELLTANRVDIVKATTALLELLTPRWSEIETILVAEPDGLTMTVCAEIPPAEMAEFFPAGMELNLRAGFDSKLAESEGAWASRRTGVWQLQGVATKATGSTPFALGVLTPRLTLNSQLKDELFKPEIESPASLLIRAVLLRRLAVNHLSMPAFTLPTVEVVTPSLPPTPAAKSIPAPHLRSIVAQIGARLPQASIEASANFLHNFPRADYAWKAIQEWADSTGSVLTISWEQFYPAHARAIKAIKRAEQPDRDDIDTVLPICWDAKSRVVRLTYSKGEPTELAY